MAVKNQLTGSQPKFSTVIQREAYKKLINDTLGDTKRASRFVSAISSAVAANPALQECDANTIICGALLGESLNLTPSPQLGQYYLVPYKKKAQFQLGYKGYIQLAIRSGYYKKINVLAIKEGELQYFNTLEEEIKVHLIEDEIEREKAPTMGYYAMFEYLNGFRKAMYWSKQKMESHANQYSKAFDLQAYRKLQREEIPQEDMWKYSSFWYKDFDTMACKTMLRQLISKWGIMSVELQEALEKDMAVVQEDGEIEYVDMQEEEQLPQQPEPTMEYETQSEQQIERQAEQQVMSDDDFFAGMG